MAKLNLNRVAMPRQDPRVRAKNYNEVALGYSAEQALEEAGRCIQCPKQPCIDGCPVEIDIPGFILALREGNMPEAVKMAVCKVNIDTDLRMAMTAKIRQVFAESPGEFDPRKYLGPAREAIKEMVKHKLQVLGCAGKAAECL